MGTTVSDASSATSVLTTNSMSWPESGTASSAGASVVDMANIGDQSELEEGEDISEAKLGICQDASSCKISVRTR